MTKRRKPVTRPPLDEPVADRGLVDEDWFDEIDVDRDGEYWRPGRRSGPPRLSDEEPEQE